MTETIIITYIPIISLNISHQKKLTVTIDQLIGMMIIAAAITTPQYITIKLSNGTIADITQIAVLPYFGYKPFQYSYTAKFGPYDVSFNNIDPVTGALQICLLFGVHPSNIITNIKHKGQPIKINFSRYFSLLSIPRFSQWKIPVGAPKELLPNFTDYPDRSVIDIHSLNKIINKNLVDSLSRSLSECFPGPPIGIIIPSELYFISTDEAQSNIIASASASFYSPPGIQQLQLDHITMTKINTAYYISNVCARTQYRGQGLAKSVLISMINDISQKGYRTFTLEVDVTNTIAYTLYTSIGFQKVASIIEEGNVYDLLLLEV